MIVPPPPMSVGVHVGPTPITGVMWPKRRPVREGAVRSPGTGLCGQSLTLSSPCRPRNPVLKTCPQRRQANLIVVGESQDKGSGPERLQGVDVPLQPSQVRTLRQSEPQSVVQTPDGFP